MTTKQVSVTTNEASENDNHSLSSTDQASSISSNLNPTDSSTDNLTAGANAPDNELPEPQIKAPEPVEEELPPVDEIKGITLFSPINNLQTSLLANLISQQTGLPCVVETDYSKRLSHITLAIVDCQGRSLEALQELVSGIQTHKFQSNQIQFRTVLLNAKQGSDHEELLDWPCIVGVFFDDTDQEQLTRGLHCLLNGEYWVPRRLLHHFLQKNRRAPSSQKLDIKLTKREHQILKLIKDGATNSDIAKALEVSEHTVKSHLYNVYKKIGVRNRLEANNWVRDMDNL